MNSAPAVSVCVTRFDRWRFALTALATLAGAGLGATITAHAAVASPWRGLWVVLAAAAAAAFGLWATRRAPVLLAWDGRQWTIAAASPSAAPDPQERRVACARVRIDLGAWLLVSLDADDRGAARLWLPIQRAGLEPQWHALRCALYSRAPRAARVAEPRAGDSRRDGRDTA